MNLRASRLFLSSALLLLMAGAARATPETPAPAVDMPRQAPELFWRAIRLLDSRRPDEKAAGRAALQAAADLEFTHAQMLLGDCLVSGSHGFTKDLHRGANLFRLAAERGNGFAEVSYGQCLFNGTGTHRDPAKAEHWLTAALSPAADYSRPKPPDSFATPVPDGDALADEIVQDPVNDSLGTAHYLLAQLYTQQRKIALAHDHLVAAASLGSGGRDGVYLAALQAATDFAFGIGTTRDLQKANAMLAQSRRLASRMAIGLVHNYVALKFVDTFAVEDLEEDLTQEAEELEGGLELKIASSFADKQAKEYNPGEAAQWYQIAADSGQTWAMLSLAFLYDGNELGKPEPEKAFFWIQKVGGGDKPRHILGVANLAICYQNGIGTAPNSTAAAELFKKYRDHDIVCYLGDVGQCPPSLVNYEDETALIFKWAKEKQDVHAAYLLALRYLGGNGVKQDFNEGVRWLRKSAGRGDAAALLELGSLYETHGVDLGCRSEAEAAKNAVDFWTKAAESNSSVAYCKLGLAASYGRGMAWDHEKATEFFERCLQLDPTNASAHNGIGWIIRGELGLSHMPRYHRETSGGKTVMVFQPHGPPVPDAAVKTQLMLAHFTTATELGHPVAPFYLGEIFREGILCPKDLRKAFGFYETAAERGNSDAQFFLGEMLKNGEGVPVSYSEAAYHYRIAALDGNEQALRNLVDFYVAGKGVSRDLDRAIFWISILIQKGNPGLVSRLGDLFMQSQNYEMAKTLFSRLEDSPFDQERAIAFQRLSVLYANGWGVKADQRTARKYREKALALNNLPALHDTAEALLREGKKAAAVAMLEQAAARDYAASKYELGRMFIEGDGVTKDTSRGFKLLTESALDDDGPAAVLLAHLTLAHTPGAPDLDLVIKVTRAAEAKGVSDARALADQLEDERAAGRKKSSE